MSPEKQRIAIAEACGWRPGRGGATWVEGQTFGIPPKGEDWHWCETPDYLNDLNAARDALLELIVSDALKEFLYRTSLETICGHDWALTFFASADQVCEAILRAIGKWEGQP